MEHQDWKTLVIRGKPLDQTKNAMRAGQYETVEKSKKNPDLHKAKIEHETENFELPRVSHALSQTIQQARTSHHWTRKELANKLNVKESVIADYENGKAIPEGHLLQKLSKILGVTLRKNM